MNAGKPLGGGDDGVFIDGSGRLLPAGFGPGNFSLYFFPNGIKTRRFPVFRNQLILDGDGVPGIDQFLQPDLVFLRELLALPVPKQPVDFLVHGVQLLQIIRHLLG